MAEPKYALSDYLSQERPGESYVIRNAGGSYQEQYDSLEWLDATTKPTWTEAQGYPAKWDATIDTIVYEAAVQDALLASAVDNVPYAMARHHAKVDEIRNADRTYLDRVIAHENSIRTEVANALGYTGQRYSEMK